MLWGRIAYDKQTSDAVFKKHMAARFPQASSEVLIKAWALAFRPLPKVQELTQGSWGLDAHWYAEASLYPQNRKWIYEKGVPKVILKSGGVFPYYLSPEYKKYYHRFLAEIAKHICTYPKEKQERI